MFGKTKKLRSIFLLYWFLLAYILAALIWWFIALNQQNRQMTQYKLEQLKQGNGNYAEATKEIESANKRKTAQYIGEAVYSFYSSQQALYLFSGQCDAS